MQTTPLRISHEAKHLCSLLVEWPRQAVAAWLAEYHSKSGPADIGQSNRPESRLKRRAPMRAYIASTMLPKPLRPFEWFAVSILDTDYPGWLRSIPDPPLVLFCVGERNALDRRSVAVVGARRCTTVGRSVAFEVARGLAETGCNLVSGLALGIDTATHRGALAAGDGATTAVLGAGFNHLYPRQNTRLAQELLAAGGLLISEYPAQVSPRPYHFPERNRIISGLSEMTVLVEASEKSGSLITARLALEQGREVCAVPGLATSPLSAGCHRLIRQGAALVTSASEVAEELGWSLSETVAFDKNVADSAAPSNEGAVVGPPMTGLSAEICGEISAQSKQFDEIVALVGRDPQQVSQCLMELQLSGFVRQGADGYICVL